MRSQGQAAGSPFIRRTSSLSSLGQLGNANTNPGNRSREDKNKEPLEVPQTPIAQLEKVLAVCVWGAVLLGRGWVVLGCTVTSEGSHRELCALLREGCLWTRTGILGVAEES